MDEWLTRRGPSAATSRTGLRNPALARAWCSLGGAVVLVAPAAVSERTAAVVVRVSVATRPVTVFTVLGRTLRVLRPSQRSLEAHQRGHGDHPHEPFDRLVVGLAEPPREVGAELLRPTLSPGARPLGVAVVLPGSWHLLHLPSGVLAFARTRTFRWYL